MGGEAGEWVPGGARNQAETLWSLMCLKLKILLWCSGRTPSELVSWCQGSPHHLLRTSFLLSPHMVSQPDQSSSCFLPSTLLPRSVSSCALFMLYHST